MKKEKGEYQQIWIRVDKALLYKVDQIAKREKRSRSNYIYTLLQECVSMEVEE